ncbi:uncharacterized protein LOC113557861 [Rhopalosiphum maidis]|uniref:uncharacterized protein LOC113557861 n=1 Tax=Rhopalosiphum maidis TaxID=43146 RepID=UPI000F009690|nr:uncharacterized protein LOC113557861 [Rhopalosiphum maidis]
MNGGQRRDHRFQINCGAYWWCTQLLFDVHSTSDILVDDARQPVLEIIFGSRTVCHHCSAVDTRLSLEIAMRSPRHILSQMLKNELISTQKLQSSTYNTLYIYFVSVQTE